MAIRIVTDTSANLPSSFINENNIEVAPFSFEYKNDVYTLKNIDDFNLTEYYESIEQGEKVTTFQVNHYTYRECFEKIAEAGDDFIYIGMSSGISGAYSRSEEVANELRETYKGRSFYTIDTKAASLGEGILVIKAVELLKAGFDIHEIYKQICDYSVRMYQIFTVDNLKHLKRTGRVSKIVATIGTLLNIKPVLKGDREGKIVNILNVRGQKKSLDYLAKKYNEYISDDYADQIIGIAHSNAAKSAEYLVNLLQKEKKAKEYLVVDYEPVTGAHVGPGTIALFFMGNAGVRELN